MALIEEDACVNSLNPQLSAVSCQLSEEEAGTCMGYLSTRRRSNDKPPPCDVRLILNGQHSTKWTKDNAQRATTVSNFGSLEEPLGIKNNIWVGSLPFQRLTETTKQQANLVT